jgi:hypothetical protein
MRDHQKFMLVEFNTISKLWEVRIDGWKSFETPAFSAAETFAHKWCDERPMANVFLSFNKAGA